VRVDKAPTAPSSAPANLEHGSNKSEYNLLCYYPARSSS
jgi:hypothetical protein